MKVQSRFDSKKIGELVCDGAMKFVDNFAVEINGERVAEYKGLDAVAVDWKDYKPVEPIIDDKHIREKLRKWMEAIGISLDTGLTAAQSGAYGLIIEYKDNRIAFYHYKKLINRRKTGLATMRELIGEEE